MRERVTAISFRSFPTIPVAFSGACNLGRQGIISKYGHFVIITDWRPKTVQQIDEHRAGWQSPEPSPKIELSLSFFDTRNVLGKNSSPVAVLVACFGKDDDGKEVCERRFHRRSFLERITFRSARPSKVRLRLFLNQKCCDLGVAGLPADLLAATKSLAPLARNNLGVEDLDPANEPILLGGASAGWMSECLRNFTFNH